MQRESNFSNFLCDFWSIFNSFFLHALFLEGCVMGSSSKYSCHISQYTITDYISLRYNSSNPKKILSIIKPYDLWPFNRPLLIHFRILSLLGKSFSRHSACMVKLPKLRLSNTAKNNPDVTIVTQMLLVFRFLIVLPILPKRNCI